MATWTATAVRDILDNPKYTGYMVWNRRKRSRPERGVRGRVNPPSEWVWSPQPTHEPLVTKSLFEAASPIGRYRQGSRSTSGANTSHPQTGRSYLLRSYLLCDLCSRRMFGKTRHKKDHDLTYYACTTNREHHKDEPWYRQHPANILVNEAHVLPFVAKFFNERIFGPNRKTYLQDQPPRQRLDARLDSQIAALRKQIHELQQAETNLMSQLEAFTPTGDADIDNQWRSRLQQRFAHLAKDRGAKTDELSALTRHQPQQTKISKDVIDQLPTLKVDLLQLPEDRQRRLFDAFQLELRYNRHLHQLTLKATVYADTIDTLRQAVQEAVAAHGQHARVPKQRHRGPDAQPSSPRNVSHVRRAPGRIPNRTVPRSTPVCRSRPIFWCPVALWFERADSRPVSTHDGSPG